MSSISMQFLFLTSPIIFITSETLAFSLRLSIIAKSQSSLFAIDKIRWKAQTIYTTEEVEAPFKRVVEKLKIISDKKINIRYYTSNSIVPNNEIWAGVKSGNLDVAFSSPSANSQKQPSLFIFSGIPFGPELTEFRVWMAYGGGQKIKDRI